MAEIPSDAITGPVVRPANRSRDQAGGIHDDSTAQEAGFRGGTVAGSIHLDHFPPLLVDAFGQAWFERGVLSMYFREPTTHLEPVQAKHARGTDGVVDAWITTPDGALVAEGVAGLATHPHPTPMRSRDRRGVDPSELDLLAGVPLGETLAAGTATLDMDRQLALLEDESMLPAPLDWYRDESPWGPAVACPSMAVHTLWTGFERTIRPMVKPAVGLYGAIEVHHRGAPLLAGVEYEVEGAVTDVSQSPRTEIFWAETTAKLDGEPVASLLMMIRLLR